MSVRYTSRVLSTELGLLLDDMLDAKDEIERLLTALDNSEGARESVEEFLKYRASQILERWGRWPPRSLFKAAEEPTAPTKESVPEPPAPAQPAQPKPRRGRPPKTPPSPAKKPRARLTAQERSRLGNKAKQKLAKLRAEVLDLQVKSERQIDELFNNLTDIQARVLARRLGKPNPPTFKALGKEWSMSARRLAEEEAAALTTLKTLLTTE